MEVLISLQFMAPPVNAEPKLERASPRQRKPWKFESASARLLGCWLADSLACQKMNWQTLSALTSVLMNHFQSLSKRKTYSNVLSGLLSLCRYYSTCSRLWNSIKFPFTLNLILLCILHGPEKHFHSLCRLLHSVGYFILKGDWD